MRQTSVPETRSERIELRASAAEKALLTRAAALERLDLTTFMLKVALPKAESVVSEADRVVLSPADTLRVMDLLENPPAPNARLQAAARIPLTRR